MRLSPRVTRLPRQPRFHRLAAGALALVPFLWLGFAGTASADDARIVIRTDRVVSTAGYHEPYDVRRLRRELRAELARVEALRCELERELAEVRRLQRRLALGGVHPHGVTRDVVVPKAVVPRIDAPRVNRDRLAFVPRAAVVVTVRGGKLDFRGRHREYAPFAFEITRGEQKWVAFEDRSGKYRDRVLVELSRDGRTLLFGVDGRRPLRFVDNGWDDGIRYGPRSSPHGGAEPQRVELFIREANARHASRR